jgi:hypothetical protein
MQNLIDNFLGRLKWSLAVKNVVEGGEGSNICDEEAKVISGFERTGPNDGNRLLNFPMEMENLG